MSAHEHQRTELLPTVFLGDNTAACKNTYTGPNGREMPDVDFSYMEFQLLLDCLPEAGSNLPTPRQLARICINLTTGCWELPVYVDLKNRARYGQLSVKGIRNPSNLAHRTMYQVFYGPDALPNGRHDFLDHLCENKACCYPRHLEVTTAGENNRRARERTVPGHPTFDFDDIT